MKTLMELTHEIKQKVHELEDAVSRTEVKINAQSVSGVQSHIDPKEISFEEERAILDKLNELYKERGRIEE